MDPELNQTQTRETARTFEVSVLKALADATRLRLLRLLFREELNVQELAHILQMGQSRISRHLSVLRNAGLARDRREGTKVYYTLSPLIDDLAPFASYMESVGKSQHPDLERLAECLFTRARHARSFADHKAEQWDEIGRLLHSSSATLLALANLVPAKLALGDFGAGTGLMLPFLAPLGGHVYAVDQSARMLSQARLRCQRLGIDNVTFIQSAIEGLDRQVPPCDGVLLHFVLHQAPRPQALIRHIARFLRPGGRLVIVDRVQHQDEKAKTTFGSVWLGFSEEQIRGWLGDGGLREFSWHAPTSAANSDEGKLDIFVAAGERAASASDQPG